MPKKTHSSVIRLRSCVRFIVHISRLLKRDQITVFAAGSSFFLLLSAVPFLMLLLSVSQVFFPFP